VAATNCLNFGNPEKPEIMAQLSAAIDGITEACNALATPVTGGNVSLYNETKGEGIYPTPVLGIVGIHEDVTKAVPNVFRAGDTLMVIGAATPGSYEDVLRSFGSSEYARQVLGQLWGAPPKLDIAQEAKLQTLLVDLAAKRLVTSASDITDGGLAVAVAEGCFASSVGASFDLKAPAEYANALGIFSEGASHVILGVAAENVERVTKAVTDAGCFVAVTGQCAGSTLRIAFNGTAVIEAPVAELKQTWASALEEQFAAEVLA
jgi:phosphoribosylformylglycinamidine (FGAM) synthase-like enzyme